MDRFRELGTVPLPDEAPMHVSHWASTPGQSRPSFSGPELLDYLLLVPCSDRAAELPASLAYEEYCRCCRLMILMIARREWKNHSETVVTAR